MSNLGLALAPEQEQSIDLIRGHLRLADPVFSTDTDAMVQPVADGAQKCTHPDVVVTAGGTRENIDDVRYIGNFSGGKLGHALAGAYARLGHSVLLLAPTYVTERYGVPAGVAHQTFTSTADLEEEMHGVASAGLVLHAAAVADYTPERIEGKLASDEDELVVHCRRTPKILQGLRSHFGAHAEIVGFKLLSDVTEAKLIDVATKQIASCATNACIANDLQQLRPPYRRLHIVAPSGEYQTLEGTTEMIARKIANIIPVGAPTHV